MIKSKGQDYFRPEASIQLQEKQYMFKMQSRMIGIRENMRRKSTHFKCEAWKKNGKRKKETQQYINKCNNLTKRETVFITTKYLEMKLTKLKRS